MPPHPPCSKTKLIRKINSCMNIFFTEGFIPFQQKIAKKWTYTAVNWVYLKLMYFLTLPLISKYTVICLVQFFCSKDTLYSRRKKKSNLEINWLLWHRNKVIIYVYEYYLKKQKHKIMKMRSDPLYLAPLCYEMDLYMMHI